MEQPQDQSHLDGWVVVWRRMAWSHWRLCISFVKQLRLLGCSLHSISPAYSSWYWKDVVGMLTYSPVSVSVSSLVITWAISKSLLKKQLLFKNKHRLYWDFTSFTYTDSCLILCSFIFITRADLCGHCHSSDTESVHCKDPSCHPSTATDIFLPPSLIPLSPLVTTNLLFISSSLSFQECYVMESYRIQTFLKCFF